MMQAVNVVTDTAHLPSFLTAVWGRVTQGLVNCNVRFASQDILRTLPPAKDGPYNAPRNSYETLAAAYYESLGYATIKLDHFVTQSVKVPTLRSGKIIDHERVLKIALDPDSYEKFFWRDPCLESVVSLSSVDPTRYPLFCYPPDFAIYQSSGSWLRRKSTFFFAEVKGPNDRLHWNQANWFIRLMPTDWRFEILAIINQKMDAIWLLESNGSTNRAGKRWSDRPTV